MHATAHTQRSNARSWRSCCGAILILLASMSALTSCATGTAAIKAPPVAPAPPPPSIDRSLRTPCPDELPPVTDSSLPALLQNHDEGAAIYHECKAGKGALIRATDEWERTAWRWYCDALDAVGLDSAECRAGLERLR